MSRLKCCRLLHPINIHRTPYITRYSPSQSYTYSMDRPQESNHHKFFEGEDHSNDYTNFRPKTPDQCIQWIVEYLSGQITKENDKWLWNW